MEHLINKFSGHRRIQLFCVGLPKSGTHSIAAVFAAQFRSAHEPGVAECMELILDQSNDRLNEAQVLAWLRERDSALQLDMESSHVMAFLVPQIARAFPESRFILTVKDPVSWLDSQINHHIGKRRPAPGTTRMRFRDFRFHAEFTHPPEELALKNYRVYTLDGYLSYWAFHIKNVVHSVPNERLLILNTQDIAISLERIASFAGIAPSELDSSKVHEYSNPRKLNVLAQVDGSYLDSKINQHCGRILDKLFQTSK